MGRCWFSILVKRRNVVVGRFSVPPVLGKSIKAENQSKNRYWYFFYWKTPQRQSSSGIKWGKWRSHQASFVVVVVYDTIQICQKMYSPSDRPLGPKSQSIPAADFDRNLDAPVQFMPELAKESVVHDNRVKHLSSAAIHICRAVALTLRSFQACGNWLRSRCSILAHARAR